MPSLTRQDTNSRLRNSLSFLSNLIMLTDEIKYFPRILLTIGYGAEGFEAGMHEAAEFVRVLQNQVSEVASFIYNEINENAAYGGEYGDMTLS
jgi:hypothetical protein